MTSIQTNAASTAALRLLRSTSSSIENAQGQASSGLRVGDSSENAAYWSIATTMRSDNMAVSAVVDALGLGGAVVDVAYTGLNAGIAVLDEIKARLVAAREPGVDKGKIQKELEQLKEQAAKIAQSSNFNGVNWLKTELSQDLADVSSFQTEVVAAFSRSSQNQVSVKTIDLDLARISMLNDGGGGLLQKDIRSLGTIGGFRGTSFTTGSHQGHQDHGFTGPKTFSPTDVLSFDLTIDASDYSSGVTTTVTIDQGVVNAALGSSTIGSGAAMRTVLEHYFTTNGVPATALSTWATNDPARFEIQSLEQSGHPGSSIAIGNVTSNFGSGLGLESGSHLIDHDNMYPSHTFYFDTAFTVHNTSEFSFDMKIGSGASSSVTIDRSTVDAALGTSDGLIGSADDLAAVLTAAGQGNGMVAIATGNAIELTADHAVYPDAGSKAPQMTLGNVQDNIGWLVDFDLEDIDVTDPAITINHYLEGVEEMLGKATNAATQLGAIQTRIESQHEFAKKISHTIDKGVGRLVDADMNETSTRLKALQTQQQLGLQSLNIANTGAEGILQLYR